MNRFEHVLLLVSCERHWERCSKQGIIHFGAICKVKLKEHESTTDAERKERKPSEEMAALSSRIRPTFEGGLFITERLDSNVIAGSRTHNSSSGNGTFEQQAPPPFHLS